ncbi:DUF6600 domain-containing protein [Azoarcus sp. DN11]|uniref:DUF6600 domain-containing protein n=1 Tax=Azoarcus sp. DN11 TaxID=356837 RepID=UPI000EAF88D3|nr:DUF6600 domain-containing protein [Azoarcus sp. DN11]AYH45848.1 hypothetical protein CDA09_23130 [Azoarcus sp. DN11]
MVSDLMKILRLALFVPLMLALTGASGTALADPPARVGRLSVVEGEVALRRDGARDWVRAGVNLPITTGDELATQPDARAEVRIGSSVLRLDQATSVEVRRLDEDRIRVKLKEGSVAMRIRSADREDAIEVETRDGIALPAEPGQYRVDFLGSATLVSNHRGHIDFRTADRQIAVTEGRRAQLWSDGPGDVQWDDPDEDAFMAWSFARDERDDRVARNRYVSPEMTGAEDLYDYGDWREYDDYGPVWFPRSVPYGWAPYRYGHWVSVAPWGWTWVDDAPWGFAPFHYGRWVRIRGSWAWVPGSYIARPVYAPALVAWIGTPGVSITYSSGLPNVGWFPLAPREVFVPPYRYSPTYVRQVNITQVTNIVEIDRVVKTPRQVRYAFRDRSDAVTRVSERILRPPTPVTLDADNRREHRLMEWERRGFPVREVVRQDGTRVRAVQPAEVRQQEGQQRPDPRQGRFAEGLRQLREQQQQQQQDPQRQRPLLGDSQDGRRDQIRQERLEALRQQQNARDRDEQARREAAAQQEGQQRQRSSLRDRLEQQRDEASRAQREEVAPRRDERLQRLEVQRQQIEQQRAERERQQVQAQEQERRRDSLRQQLEQQRQQEAGEREARRQQQFEQLREERSRQQAAQAQEQERRRDALRQQMEQREREAQVQQQRQMQIQQQQQQQAEQQRNQIGRFRERLEQREAQQQDNRRGGDEEQQQQQRRRRPFGQDGERQ